MQEQLPLRPAEFVKIRDGFIAFLKQPAGTPIEHVVPQHIIDAMTSAAKRGRKRRRVLDVTKSASVFVAVAGAIVGLAINPMIVGTVIMLAGGMAFVWHRAERPVLSVLRGTTSRLRIDGPRQFIGKEDFAMGALLESPGVTAHLDPVDTFHLEARIRQTIENEILRWIAEHDLQACPPVLPSVDRDAADPEALRRMVDWVHRDRWIEEQSYVR